MFALTAVAAACALAVADASLRSLILRTLQLSLGSALLSLTLAVPIAWLLTRADVAGRRIAWPVLLTLLWIPLYLHAGAWQAGFGLQGGYSLITGAPALIEGIRGAIWIHGVYGIPLAALVIAIGFGSVPTDIEEEASLDAGALIVFRRITLPRSLGAIAAAGVIVAVLTAAEMTVTNLLLVRTMTEEIYTQISLGDATVDTSALPLPAILLTASLLGAAIWAAGSIIPKSEQASARQRRPLALRHRWLVFGLLWTVLLLIVMVPLISFFYKAGILITRDELGWHRSWSIAKSLRMVAESPERFGKEFGWSIGIGSLAAAISTSLGALFAWHATQSRTRSIVVLSITAICWAIPGSLIGLGMIWALNRPESDLLLWLYDHTIFAPTIAQVIRAVPIATLILWHAFATLPRELFQAAAIDGAGPWRSFLSVSLASRRSSALVALLAAFSISIGELAATILVIPPGVNTLPITIFGLIHYGVDDQVAGICLVLVGLFTVISLIALWLMRSRDEA